MKILLPMTCNILTKGHIRLIDKLASKHEVVIGLLSTEALKGYKNELMPYKDREFIIDRITDNMLNIEIAKQTSLDPSHLIKKYNICAIASGDGFHPKELEAIKKFNLKMITVKSGEKLHSSDIYECHST